MRALITGASGLVGHLIAEGLTARGWQVTRLGRQPGDIPFALGDQPDLPPADMLIHSAFAHVPGRYRGGEGDDPDGFRRLNLDGSVALFYVARRASIPRVVFLSSRAVYGRQPPGTPLTEDTPPAPDTLYGEVKLAAETALAGMAGAGFTPISIRATGVYGPPPPGRAHKWAGLFEDFRAGKAITPRVATELHGDDLAAAAALLAAAPAGVYNASDLVLDRYELLTEVAALTGWNGPLPDRADPGPLNVMATDKLSALGWRPGGMAQLRATLPSLLQD